MKALGEWVCRIANIISAVFIAIALFFIPFVPSELIDKKHPLAIDDKRITVAITKSDLEKINHLVRGGNFISAYEYLYLSLNNGILSIRESSETSLQTIIDGSYVMEVIPPVGKIVVDIGYICGPLCGSGVRHYVDMIDGEWRILKSTHWIS